MGDMKVFQKDASIRLAVGETPDMFAGISAQRAASESTRVAAAGPDTETAVFDLGAQKPARAVVAAKRSRVGRNKVAQIDHLAAARKLQWQLRRTRAHSPEEVKTGRLICRHLLALLSEAADSSEAQRDSGHAASRRALG